VSKSLKIFFGNAELKHVAVFKIFECYKAGVINITTNTMLAETYAVWDVNRAFHSLLVSAWFAGTARVCR
jgi:hypothetical protein